MEDLEGQNDAHFMTSRTGEQGYGCTAFTHRGPETFSSMHD